MRIAMINGAGRVYNTAIWDGVSAWTPHAPDLVAAGCLLIDVSDQPVVGPGWAYDGHTFTAPAPPELVIE